MTVAIKKTWPYVNIKFAPGYTTESFGEMLEEFECAINDGRRFAVLCDSRDVNPLNAIQRKMVADVFERHRYAIKQRIIGIAFVMTNPLHRGVITAINWISPWGTQIKTFKDPIDAGEWLSGLRDWKEQIPS